LGSLDKLKMRLEPSEEEAYLPEVDAYISVTESGLITVKKASGQECFQLASWDMERKRIALRRGVKIE
jgi:hypothetical protein